MGCSGLTVESSDLTAAARQSRLWRPFLYDLESRRPKKQVRASCYCATTVAPAIKNW